MKLKTLLLVLLFFSTISFAADLDRKPDFADRFKEITKTASKEQLYAFLWAIPKGGDLHNHSGSSFFAYQYFEDATNKALLKGNEFFTRVRFNICPGGYEPFIRFRTIQRSTYLKLSDCEKQEYVHLESLSPEMKAEWISASILDKPGEGRNEFFEVLGQRRGDLGGDPNIMLDLLIKQMQLMGAQNMLYLETQARPRYRDQDGNPIDEERGVTMLRERLNSPEAKATGVTVRFLSTISRFAPDAEQQVEAAYKFIDAHHDLWVGMNMAGREDNDKGYPSRFMEIHRKLRRTYPDIHLALHGGEVDSPGEDVRKTLLLGADRIGHGVNLISDPDTMLFMRHNRYLVEINLISNNLLEYVPDLSKHPFPEYLRLGIPVCLNTDDPGAWDSNMTDEYYTAVKYFNLTWKEIVQIGRDSLQYSFVEEPVKAKLLEDYDKHVLAFEAKYGTGDWRKLLSDVKPMTSGYTNRTLGITY
ncbi:MAG: Aminodeoxyfutalosine deaminase [Bryobacterales bacterium]|nr:Aminodeoxyfutalosine deaminase [Bryobacterales bacterium]